MKIPVQLSKNLKQHPDENNLGFGKYFTDHMFVSYFNRKVGWHKSEIVPYGPLALDPGASALHYGQALFEGMKAFRQKNDRIVLFRPDFNWQRMKEGAERLCLEAPPLDLFIEGVRNLVRVDQAWVPHSNAASLYIRPTLIGSESFLGVRPADEYLFFVILSPVGGYYGASADISPVKIWIEKNYLRAAPGGLGATKAAANYASSLKAAYEAKKKNYAQVLWLDQDRKNVSEVGTMNVFFVVDDVLITPELDGSILAGGVRDCVLKLALSWNLKIEERKISLQEIKKASVEGRLQEAFGTGTAAVISPISEFANDDFNIQVKHSIGPLAKKLSNEITGLQYGTIPDTWNWTQAL